MGRSEGQESAGCSGAGASGCVQSSWLEVAAAVVRYARERCVDAASVRAAARE
ncbi:MAG: hypothetical protein R3A48_15155 [Polyangiales bacterium]